MGLFSRKARQVRPSTIIPAGAAARLPAIRRSVFRDGQATDVSDFYLPGFIAGGSPSPGSPAWDAFTDQFLDELLAAASGGWGVAGAFHVAKDFVTAEDWAKPAFEVLTARALQFMAEAGVPVTHVPMGLLHRYQELRTD